MGAVAGWVDLVFPIHFFERTDVACIWYCQPARNLISWGRVQPKVLPFRRRRKLNEIPGYHFTVKHSTEWLNLFN